MPMSSQLTPIRFALRKILIISPNARRSLSSWMRIKSVWNGSQSN